MPIETTDNPSAASVPVSLSTDIHNRCLYCGVYPGQYHHPDCGCNKSDDKRKGKDDFSIEF